MVFELLGVWSIVEFGVILLKERTHDESVWEQQSMDYETAHEMRNSI